MAAKEKGADKTADTKATAAPAESMGAQGAEVKTNPVVEPDNAGTDNSSANIDAGINGSTEKVPEVAALEDASAVPEAVSGEVVEMVTVTVPKAYSLNLDLFRKIEIKAGVQEMERAWAEHWWSKANGVTIYEPSKK